MTTRQMLITTGSQHLPCGQPVVFHNDATLFTTFVHGSSTQLQPCPPAKMWFVHNIHRPYDDDETYQDGSRPEYLGTNDSRSRPAESTYPEPLILHARCWPTVLRALGSIRTSVKHIAVSLSAPMQVEGRVTDEVSG